MFGRKKKRSSEPSDRELTIEEASAAQMIVEARDSSVDSSSYGM